MVQRNLTLFDYIAPEGLGTWRCQFIGSRLSYINLTPENDTLIPATLDSHQQAQKQLDDFFASNGRHLPEIPTELPGTPFQQSVWQQLRAINAGSVKTYQDIATILKTSPRAVGNACRANHLPIVFPCHRVVAKNHLGGYMGIQEHTLKLKQNLLNLEQEIS